MTLWIINHALPATCYAGSIVCAALAIIWTIEEARTLDAARHDDGGEVSDLGSDQLHNGAALTIVGERDHG